MKLLRCYVENYGTLSKYSQKFDDGLTVICEENGFGKSTLASFIAAMFYGLPQTTKRKLEENERKLRTPWQGGSFGGILEFSINERSYRIERFFAEKANADSFKLFDLESGTESFDYDENIGVQIFGIDAEGFQRSIFLPQLITEATTNTSITAKLTNLVENSDDINNYDSAMEILKKRKTEYLASRGKKGSIVELKEKIETAEARLTDANTAKENLNMLTDRLGVYKQQLQEARAELSKVRNELSAASDAAATIATKKRADELKSEIEQLEVEIATITGRYKGQLPTDEQLDEAFEKLDGYKNAVNEYKFLSVNDADQSRYKELDKLFEGNDITDEALESAGSMARELGELKAEIKSNELLLSENNTQKSINIKPLILIAAVMAAIGVGALFINIIAGLIMMFVSLCVGAVAAFMFLKGLIMSNPSKADTKSLIKEQTRLQERAAEIENRLLELLQPFEISGDYIEQCYKLGLMRSEFIRLKALLNDQTTKLENASLRKNDLKAYLESFCEEFFAFKVDNYTDALLQVRDDIRNLKQAKNDLLEKQQKLLELPTISQEKLICDFDKDELVKLENRLGPQVDSLSKTVLELEANIEALSLKADGANDLENELVDLKTELAEKEQELFVIEKATELLETARINLSSKYKNAVSEGFKKYAELMLGKEIGDFMLDSELNINIDRFGAARDKDFFSVGYKNLIDIAMRLALVDALYGQEIPPVIMDDPFVNLDEKRIDNALELIKKLANNRQIIYLTCHKSRCI